MTASKLLQGLVASAAALTLAGAAVAQTTPVTKPGPGGDSSKTSSMPVDAAAGKSSSTMGASGSSSSMGASGSTSMDKAPATTMTPGPGGDPAKSSGGAGMKGDSGKSRADVKADAKASKSMAQGTNAPATSSMSGPADGGKSRADVKAEAKGASSMPQGTNAPMAKPGPGGDPAKSSTPTTK